MKEINIDLTKYWKGKRKKGKSIDFTMYSKESRMLQKYF